MHITTYLREEGVGTLYTYRLALAVNLYSHRKEELQPTVTKRCLGSGQTVLLLVDQ